MGVSNLFGVFVSQVRLILCVNGCFDKYEDWNVAFDRLIVFKVCDTFISFKEFF